MLYVDLEGTYLRQALAAKGPKNGNLTSFLSGIGKKLQEATSIDSDSIGQALSGSGTVRLPLYAVAMLARAIGYSVEYLLVGQDEVDDPNVLTPVDYAHIASANSFIEFLSKFVVDFPLILWDYGFPKQRKGSTSALSASDWANVYRERYEREPEGRR